MWVMRSATALDQPCVKSLTCSVNVNSQVRGLAAGAPIAGLWVALEEKRAACTPDARD